MLSTASLGYLTVDDPVLYDWLSRLTAAFNQLQQRAAAPAAAGAAVKTGSYTIETPDDGRLLVAKASTPLTFSLPANVPSGTFRLYVANLGTGILTVSAAPRTIDGIASFTLAQYQSAYIATDGSSYFTAR